MQFDWNNWNVGGKIVFVAAILAVVSMFMKWVDVGIASQNGFSQGTFLLLGLWVYPVIKLMKNKDMSNLWGIGAAALSILFVVLYISSKTAELMGESVNAASNGAFLFLVASVALVVGVIKYEPVEKSEPQES